MTVILLILAGFIGALLASALDCLAWRQTKGESWKRGTSHCDYCGASLNATDLIPIFSYLCRRSKTRCCKRREVPWHVLLELLGALGLVFATIHFLESRNMSFFLRDLLLIGVSLYIAAKDLFSGLVSLPLTLTLIVVFLLWPTPEATFLHRALGLWVGAALLLIPFLLTNKKGLGEGDIWLGALLGVTLGVWKVWPALALAFIVGGAFAAVLLLTKQKKRTDAIPFGPFLVLALLVTHFLL